MAPPQPPRLAPCVGARWRCKVEVPGEGAGEGAGPSTWDCSGWGGARRTRPTPGGASGWRGRGRAAPALPPAPGVQGAEVQSSRGAEGQVPTIRTCSCARGEHRVFLGLRRTAPSPLFRSARTGRGLGAGPGRGLGSCWLPGASASGSRALFASLPPSPALDTGVKTGLPKLPEPVRLTSSSAPWPRRSPPPTGRGRSPPGST